MYLCPCLLAAALTAQVSTPPTGSSAKPGSIEGTVVNAVTHAPVRGASIALAGPPNRNSLDALSDDTGKFTFAGVSPGSYRIQSVQAQGYMFQRPGPRSIAGAPIAVAEERTVTGVTIELMPLGVIAGKVVDDDGEPLRRVTIQAIGYSYTLGRRNYSTAGSTGTDDRGQFRLIDLPPGRYFVRASFATFTDLVSGDFSVPPPNTYRTFPQLGYAPTFFPNAADAAEATASVVAAGSETSGVDFRLHAVPVFHIRGKVSNPPAGGPLLVGARNCAWVDATGFPWPYTASTQTDGSFDLRAMAPGVYCVALIPNGRNSDLYASATFVLKDRDLENVDLAATPLLPVSGVVEVEGNADLPPGPSVFLRNPNGAFGRSAQVKAGKFSMDDIFPDTYLVSLNGLPPAMYLKSIRYGTEDVPGGTVSIRGDGSLLTLKIGSDAGSLSGTVQTESGDPAAGAMVTAVPDDLPPGRGDLVKSARTDQSGKFTLQGVPPGPCKVYAWEDPEYYNLAMVPEFVKEFAASAAAATVSAGGRDTVQVKLIPADEAQRVKARL
jgi:hypothetical protein